METEQKLVKSQPYFTIVVPSYNREKFIARTLQSIQKQSFDDFEVIVVDDCSKDNTVRIIQVFLKDKRFRLIRNPENYERAKSRNIGMRIAQGKFLTLLDSDDLMYPDNLKDAYHFTQDHPECLFFRNFFEMVDESGNVLKKFSTVVHGDDRKKLAKENFISCIGVFTAREIYQNYFFDEDPGIVVSEDWEYWLRVRASYELGTIKKINSAFTEHPNRSMAMFDPLEIEKRKLLVIKKVMKNPATRKIYGKYEAKMKVAAYLFVAVQANIAGFPQIAWKYLQKASKISIWEMMQVRTAIILKNILKSLV